MDGTDEMSIQQKDAAGVVGEAKDDDKYVVFRLGNELYGARLLDVREVVETMPIKAVPNTIPSFQGVCNLRGQVIGVIDLRKRFTITAPPVDRPVMFIFETDSGAIAAAVDQVDCVTVISPQDVDTKVNIVASIPLKYILGVGKQAGRMIILVALKDILTHEELRSVESSKILAKAS